jgi:hypothetical protein
VIHAHYLIPFPNQLLMLGADDGYKPRVAISPRTRAWALG